MNTMFTLLVVSAVLSISVDAKKFNGLRKKTSTSLGMKPNNYKPFVLPSKIVSLNKKVSPPKKKSTMKKTNLRKKPKKKSPMKKTNLRKKSNSKKKPFNLKTKFITRSPTNYPTLNECEPRFCNNWDTRHWCMCYNDADVGRYEMNGCGDDGSIVICN